MKKRILLSSVIIFGCQLVFSQSAWEQRTDFPGDARSAVTSFGFSDFGYVGLGYDGEDFRRSFYAYDPATDIWLQTESLGGAVGAGTDRNMAAAFTMGNIGFVGTGQGGDPFLKDFWAYDHTTNTWELKANVGGIDRRGGIGFSANGKGYIGLGQDAVGYRKDLWQYDTTANAWTQKADFTGTPRRLAVSFVTDNRVFVGTGDDGGFKNDFFEYNAVTNSWIVRSNFGGSPRYGAVGFGVNGKGYIACGYDTTLTNQSDFWEYDPIADSWLQLDDFPGGKRSNATAFVVDTLAFVGMGYDTSFMSDIWMWGDTVNPENPDTNIAIINLPNTLASINIYPNPITTTANIIIDLDEPIAKMQIKVIDMRGADYTSSCTWQIDNTTALEKNITFQASQLPPGMYQFIAYNQQIIGIKNFIVL